MKLRELSNFVEATILYGDEILNDIDVEYAYGADLMSDVLAFARPGSLLLTGLTNVQIIRTAQMLDIPAVIFVRGKRPQKETVELASKIKMPVLLVHKSMFETCGILYREGILPCSIPSREV
ncbi:MAG: transcriptional regulator [Synergistales bacterium]|nr:transcriptional regulator [Synergistales bacterium]